MAINIEPAPATKPTLVPSEVEVCTTGNMCATDSAQYERSRSAAPAILFHKILVAEFDMKLIKKYALTGRLRRDVLRVDIGVLPCPANFDQVIFITEAHTERNSKARARFQYDARVRPRDMGLDRKAHARAITDEWSEIETQRFG